MNRKQRRSLAKHARDDSDRAVEAVTALFLSAVEFFQTGQPAEATRTCRRILARTPRHAGSLHLLGVMAAQSGRHAEAAGLIAQAIEIDPADALAHNNLGVELKELGEMARSAAAYRKAIELKPDYADAYNNLGVTLVMLGQVDEAVAVYRKALAYNPGAAETHNNLGIALHQLARYEDATAAFNRAIDLKPRYPQAYNALGVTLKELGQIDDALLAYRRALQEDPTFADAYSNIGNALRDLGRYDDSLDALTKAVELQPYNAEIYNNLGATFAAMTRFDDAIACYTRALALRPDTVKAHFNLGNALKERGRPLDAIDSYNRAIALQPGYSEAFNNLGIALKELGRHSEALAAFEDAARLASGRYESPLVNKAVLLTELGRIPEGMSAITQALEINPRSAHAWELKGDLKTFAVEDSDLDAMEALLAECKARGGSSEDVVRLEFALGKAWLDAGDGDRAFAHFAAGNALQRLTVSYDAVATTDLARQIGDLFTRDRMTAMGALGLDSELPIFVIGMPRSGTTLIEQILASHRDIEGAGELTALAEIVKEIPLRAGPSAGFPHGLDAMSQEDLHDLGQQYLARITPLAQGKRRVVDKMPSNFFFAGLIHLILPNARIIHCRRNPIDTCVSCYTKKFARGQEFSYDLAELGGFYRGYQGLMQHWRDLLPADRFMEVDYENVVADLEGEARRLIAFCGLAWDDACLAFHETKRPVQTASFVQVRQPIYRSSIGKWKPQATHLRPLLDALGVEAEDR